MVENKAFKWTNYYVEFLEHMNEASSKVFTESSKVYSQFMESLLKVNRDRSKGTFFFQDPEEMKEIYKNTLDHVKKILEPYTVVHPYGDEIADLASRNAEKGFDFCTSLFSTQLDFYQKAGEVSRNTWKACQEMVGVDKVLKPGEIIKKWTGISVKILEDLVKSPFTDAIPVVTAKYVEYLRSGVELRKKVLEYPYVSKKEFCELSKDVKEVKELLEKGLKEREAQQATKKTAAKVADKKK